MKTPNYRSRTVDGHRLHPETLMMGYGYSPALSEGALKPPIFLTSTFVFENAQQGKDFFDLTAGRAQDLRQPRLERAEVDPMRRRLEFGQTQPARVLAESFAVGSSA